MSTPAWYAAALAAGFLPNEEGAHGFYSAVHPNGYALSDADLCGSEAVGASYPEGWSGPVFYTVEEGIAWCNAAPPYPGK